MKKDDLERRFEGREALQKLLAASGTLADVEDVVEAFRAAAKDGAPAQVVISALWEDEPRFTSTAQARALFSNLFGLYDLVASGEQLDLGPAPAKAKRTRREKAPPPEPLGDAVPDDAYVEACWRYLDDFPKERERHQHAFDNRQDALVSFLDASGLSDVGFGLARHLASDVFAMLELGGLKTKSVREADIPAKADATAVPEALARWVEEGVFEEEQDEEAPLPAHEAEHVRDVTLRAATALWNARR